VSAGLVDAVGVVFGAAMLLLGIRVRWGGLRERALLYRDFRLPWFLRNSAFGLIPGGIAFICIGAIGFASPPLGHPFALLVVLVAAPLPTVSLALALLWTYRPPDIAKPAWLIEEETRHGKPTDPHVWGRRLDRASVLIVVVPALLAAIVILLSGAAWLIPLLLG